MKERSIFFFVEKNALCWNKKLPQSIALVTTSSSIKQSKNIWEHERAYGKDLPFLSPCLFLFSFQCFGTYLFQILRQENFVFNLCIYTWLQTPIEDFHMNRASTGHPVQMESPVKLKSSRSLAWFFFPQSDHLLVTSPLPSDYFYEACWSNIMSETSIPL